MDGCVGHTDGHPERLHPLYTIDGLELGPEAVIDTLPGYAGSRPVRVGNAANRQIQLDVFGPIADLIAAVVEARGTVRNKDWRGIEAMVQAVERRWHEPDHGVWEARLPPRHHVYSKVMCWLTVDRALQVQARRDGAPRADWVELRERIRADVLEHGWNEAVGRVYRRLRRPRDRRLVALDRAVRACSPTTIRASSRPCSRSRRSCAAVPSSTATAGTTGCRGSRAVSTSARPG